MFGLNGEGGGGVDAMKLAFNSFVQRLRLQ